MIASHFSVMYLPEGDSTVILKHAGGLLTMKVQLLVTIDDACLPNLEHEFRDLGISYQVDFVEEHPELVSALQIRHSPNILVDGELAFRHQPTEGELKNYFARL